MRAFPRLLLFVGFLLCAPQNRIFADTSPGSSSKWERAIEAFEEQDKEKAPPKHAILFVGSSSIRKWTGVADDFPQHQVLNRGFGGSHLSDTAYYADRIILPYEPRFIVVYAGGNDLAAKKDAEEILVAFQQIVDKVRAKQPDTPIAFVSIAGNPKRWGQVDVVKKANALVEAFIKEHSNLIYIDVFHPMLGEDGLPKPEIFGADRLHMNPEGYRLWRNIIAPYLPAGDQEPRVPSAQP